MVYVNRGIANRFLGASVFALATIINLTHCGSKEGSSPSPTSKVSTDGPGKEVGSANGGAGGKKDLVVTGATIDLSSVVEGELFSELETTTTSPSAKALFLGLKEKKNIDSHLLAMALVEMHLKAAGQASGSDQQTIVLQSIAQYAEANKATKVEALKGIYARLEKARNRKMSYSKKALTISSVLGGNELQGYSGTSYLALAWLKTPEFDVKNAVVLVEDGELKLAEIRNNRVMAIRSTTSTAVAQDRGALADFNKKSDKKIISLKLFVIHEVFRALTKNAETWAFKIQNKSNEVLGLNGVNEKKPLVGSSTGAVDGKQNLLLGVLKDLPEGDLSEEVIEKPEEKPEPLKAEPPKAEPPKPESPKPESPKPESPKPESPKAEEGGEFLLRLNADCVSSQSVRAQLAAQKRDDQSAEALMRASLATFINAGSGAKRTMILVNLEDLKSGLLDEGLVKSLKEVLINSGYASKQIVLRLLMRNKELKAAQLLVIRDTVTPPLSIDLPPEIPPLLENAATKLKASELDELIVADRQGSCEIGK